MYKFILKTCIVVILTLLIVAPNPVPTSADSCANRVNNTTKKLLECVTVAGVREHQAAFQDIADDNGGTRASGFPGYDASVDYVVEKMEAAGYNVTVQPFDFDFFEELSPSEVQQTAPNDVTYTYLVDFFTMDYSGAGTVEAPVQAVDLVLPPGAEANSSSSGCEDSDFDTFTAGNIALMQRGTCAFRDKAINAAEAGAVGAIIFNEGQPGRDALFGGTLGGLLPPDAQIPVLSASFAFGNSLNDLLEAGDLVLRITTDTFSETRSTANVLAETKEGRNDNVVMVGAHLDSVPEGPGIQDNGSGSAAILEVAEQMAKVKPRNKVRFAWWGAEEAGLVGSTLYVLTRSDEELSSIALYLNFDMIGSPNYVRYIYDGDGSGFGITGPPGSNVIEAFFEDFYEDRDLAFEPTAFDGRSDYDAFIDVGIPAGGLFTGAEGIKTPEQVAIYGGTAGEQYDPCYHAACDTFDNVSLEVLDLNSDAIAAATLQYAMNTQAVNGERGKGNFKPEDSENQGNRKKK